MESVIVWKLKYLLYITCTMHCVQRGVCMCAIVRQTKRTCIVTSTGCTTGAVFYSFVLVLEYQFCGTRVSSTPIHCKHHTKDKTTKPKTEGRILGHHHHPILLLLCILVVVSTSTSSSSSRKRFFGGVANVRRTYTGIGWITVLVNISQ